MKLVPVARLWEAESNQGEIRVLGPDPPQAGARCVPGSGDGPPLARAPSHRTECPSQPVPRNGSAADVREMILAVCATLRPRGPGCKLHLEEGCTGAQVPHCPSPPQPWGCPGLPIHPGPEPTVLRSRGEGLTLVRAEGELLRGPSFLE